jgi:hypothetical protein
MQRIFSNGPVLKDFVINPFMDLVANSTSLLVAAPFVTKTDELIQAAKNGRDVKLIVGVNASTSPETLSAAHNVPNLEIRYFTDRFHAKIYIADEAALVGSSNLTDGGLRLNREATILLSQVYDSDAIDELRTLFAELWNFAEELTPEKLNKFVNSAKDFKRSGPAPDSLIAAAVDKAEPPNVNVASTKKTAPQIFLKQLQYLVYSQYRPAFNKVTELIEEKDFRRAELADVGIANETNLFLSWVRLTHAPGNTIWESAPLRFEDGRRDTIFQLGLEWKTTEQSKVANEYKEWLHRVQPVFRSRATIEDASKEDLTARLMSIHAFYEQLRFVKGGAANLPGRFWGANNDDVVKVKKTLTFLLYGDNGDFTRRLHDVLYDSSRKLGNFGKFCALELYGTVKPQECPPLNGRIAKALRFIGFDVPGE